MGFILATLLMGGATILAASTRNIEVTYGVNIVVDGVLQEFQEDMRPFMSGNRTFAPVRGIAYALGANVEWDAATQTVYLVTTPTTPAAYSTTAPTTPTPALDDPYKAHYIIGSWHFSDFTAAYPRFSAPSDNMIVTFTADGYVVFSHGDGTYDIDTFTINGNRIIFGRDEYYDMTAPIATFHIDGDRLSLSQGFHFTRATHYNADDLLIGLWEHEAIAFDLRPDGTAVFTEPGYEDTGRFYVYDDILFLTWEDYWMMAYFYEVDETSLSLILTIMEFSRE